MLEPSDNAVLTRTGAGTPAGELFRRFWVPVMLSSELPEPDCAPVRVTVMGEALLAFRDTDGNVGLVDAYCPHRGAPLFFGRNEERGIRCVFHGWKFDVHGRCVDMPNEPANSRFKDHVRLPAYPTKEAGGAVWAYLGPGDLSPEMPDLEWLRLPAGHVYIDKILGESNYLQALEGDHDSSHASLLHSTLKGSIIGGLGREDQLTDYHMGDKAPRLSVLETNYGLMTASRRNASAGTYLWRIVPWLMPFYSIIANEPGTTLILNIRIPMDDESHWSFRIAYNPDRPIGDRERTVLAELSGRYSRRIPGSWRAAENLDNDYLIDRNRQRFESFSGIPNIPAQDRAVQEGMRPEPGTRHIVDRSRENLGSADASIILLRKLLLKAVRDLQAGNEPAQAHDGARYFLRAVAIELPRDVPFDVGAEPYISGRLWKRRERHVVE